MELASSAISLEKHVGRDVICDVIESFVASQQTEWLNEVFV